MTPYSAAFTTIKYPYYARAVTVIITAGTGSVLIEVNRGDDTWQTVETYTADEVVSLQVAGAQFRITPSGDATFSVGGS